MLAALLPVLAPIIEKLVDRIPDPRERERAMQEAMGKLTEMAAEQSQQQSDINKIEAGSASLFVAGWRPFIGWICGFALGYHFILQPLLAFTLAAFHVDVTLPVFNMDTLMTILMGMLGLGAMRTFEKVQGVTTGLATMPPIKPAPAVAATKGKAGQKFND